MNFCFNSNYPSLDTATARKAGNASRSNANASKSNPDANKSESLLRRLDFSTRQPISAQNFADKPVAMATTTPATNASNEAGNNGKVNLQITAHLETAKRVVNIDRPQTQSRGNRSSGWHGGQQTLVNGGDGSARFDGHSHGGNASGTVMGKSNSVHVMGCDVGGGGGFGHNGGGKGVARESYDEYCFNEYEVEAQEEYQGNQRVNQMGRQNNRRSVKGRLNFF